MTHAYGRDSFYVGECFLFSWWGELQSFKRYLPPCVQKMEKTQ